MCKFFEIYYKTVKGFYKVRLHSLLDNIILIIKYHTVVEQMAVQTH